MSDLKKVCVCVSDLSAYIDIFLSIGKEGVCVCVSVCDLQVLEWLHFNFKTSGFLTLRILGLFDFKWWLPGFLTSRFLGFRL